jgi:hypothetical protein
MFVWLLPTIILLPSVIATTPGFPTAIVAVGPDGVTLGPTSPYYLMVNVTQPETPHYGSPTDDCAGGTRPQSATDTVGQLMAALLQVPPDVLALNSVEPYVPRCIPVPITACTPLGCQPTGLYASYDVSTGRYYVEAHGVLANVGARPGDIIITGTTGANATADCLGCPPIKDIGGG